MTGDRSRNLPPQWLSSVNAAIVRTAARDGVVTAAGLLGSIADSLGAQTSAHLMARRLRWLRDCGWLANVAGATHRGVWRLTAAAQAYIAAHGAEFLPARLDGALPARERADRIARRAVAAGPVAPPPRRNVLHGPVWQPPAWQSARPRGC